jgi:hypothetical protein
MRRDGWAAGETSGQEARHGSSGHGGGGSVLAAVLRTRARRARRDLYNQAQGGGRVPCVSRLRSHGMGGGRQRRVRPVRRRQGWVAGVVSVDAWREQDGGRNAPPDLPTLAAWHPWGLDVCAGPTAASACVRGAACRALECQGAQNSLNWPALTAFFLIFSTKLP